MGGIGLPAKRESAELSSGVNSTDPYAPLRSLRGVQHARKQKRLFILDKDARLRSGARGMAARKALLAFEKEVADFEEQYVLISLQTVKSFSTR
jgi:hypothetical protein